MACVRFPLKHDGYRKRERERAGTDIFGKASYRNGARCLVQPTLPKTNIATENRPYQKGK